MGFSFSSQPLTSDTSSDTSNATTSKMDSKKKPMTSAAAFEAPKKPVRQSNAMLQMDDFLSLARDPVVAKKAVVVPEKKVVVPVVVVEKKMAEEGDLSGSGSEDGKDETGVKKKRDRNAALAPKKKTEDPKKAKRLEAIKKKKEEAEAETLKKKEDELASELSKLKLEEEAKLAEEALEKAKELAEANKEPRLQEIVQEYLACAPGMCKYRGRNSELMNIVHDLVGLNRSVEDYPAGLTKEDKKYLKLEEFLTRCLLKFDNIERSSEVLIKTRKQLIDFTNRLLAKLEARSLMEPVEEVAEAKGKKNQNKKKVAKQDSVETLEEAAVTSKPDKVVQVEDVKIEEEEKVVESIEEILKKKGKSKKPKKK